MELFSIARTSLKWSSASQFGRQALQFAATVVFARLLSPSDFGLMGMAMVLVGFINVFKDLGTSAALIRQKVLTERLISSLFVLNITFGLSVSVVVCMAAPFIAEFYREARLVPIIQLLSMTFLVSGFGVTSQSILERNLEFRKLATLELVASSLGFLVGIGLAILGKGVWALVMQTFVTVLISSTLLLLNTSHWKSRMIFDWQELKSIIRYSLNLSGFNVSNYFVRNADNILIGRFLGAQDLGFYMLAYRIMLYPLQNITAVISRITFPLYSRINEDNDKIRNAYLRVVRAVAFITIPMMLGMFGVSRYFVLTFFGDRWIAVGTLLLVFSPIGLLQSIDATTGAIYQTKGRTDWMFRWGLATGVLALACFVVGLQWGIFGVALSYMFATLIWTYPGFAIPFKLINLSVSVLVKNIWRPLMCGMVMLTAILLTGVMLGSHISNVHMLAILCTLGICIYLLASFAINRTEIDNILSYL